MKLFSALLAILREKHLIHGWVYHNTHDDLPSLRICHHCGARERFESDDWGGSWVKDTSPAAQQPVAKAKAAEVA